MLEPDNQAELATSQAGVFVRQLRHPNHQPRIGCVANSATSIEQATTEDDDATMSIELLKDISTRVLSLESDSRRNTCDIATIKTTIAHMPTKLWIAAWGLTVLGALTLAQWRVITVLLQGLGAQLASDVARAITQ
ncbi:hypothetical protein [Pinirhizobacter sp.]|jgi:hypothetical protein|uniref:hypothetical protein n=1 Tax=Pinirhizobacter sp. TaxID=2950432 RepID=UPI002F3EE804